MDITITKAILAIITNRPEKVGNSSVPTFICDNEEERDRVAFNLSKLTDSVIHDLGNGVLVAVRH
ncbi:MAG TPA: hypothetical protein VFD33_06550 [Bacillota bacterium]|nr:hypothetical protein [Bacillota bacterium]